MSRESDGHPLNGTYRVTVSDGHYETDGHTVVIDRGRGPGQSIHCREHEDRFRYHDASWDDGVRGELEDLKTRERLSFRIERVPPDEPRTVRCSIGGDPTEPGSWTAEDTGGGKRPPGRPGPGSV